MGRGCGCKDARQTFLGYWLRLVVAGEELQIWGDGLQKRDFNYVDDAVRALLLAATRRRAVGKVYNLGDDEVVSLKELAELLVAANGQRARTASCRFPQTARRSTSVTTTGIIP